MRNPCAMRANIVTRCAKSPKVADANPGHSEAEEKEVADMIDPMFDVFDAFVGFVAMIALTVSGWIVTMQVRRRMKKSLGRKATDLDLASLNTWMRVEEAEQRDKESSPIHPH